MFELSEFYSIAVMGKIIIAFCLLYIIIPFFLIKPEPETDKLLDKVFISLTHSVFITIIIVHALAFMKLYETFSLLLCYFLVYLTISWGRSKSWLALADALGMKAVVHILNISENRTGVLGGFGNRFKVQLQGLGAFLKHTVMRSFREPFYGLLPIGVFLYAVYLRFNYAVTYASYTMSDCYEHLVWTKFIGANRMYVDGIYQYGYHAVMSPLDKLFFINPYWLIRFMGPLTGVLLLLSIYYGTLRITKNNAAGLITMVVFGLVTNPTFPIIFYRQATALPMEFASVFLLPGLYFLWLYFKTQKKSYLLLYAEVLAITVFSHAFAAMYFALWVGVMFILAVIFMRVGFKTILNFISYSFLAGIVGLFPVIIGLLRGDKFFAASFDFISSNIKTTTAIENANKAAQPIQIITGNYFLDIGLMLGLLICALVLIKVLLRNKEDKVLTLTVAVCSLLNLALYRANELGLPTLTEKSRTGAFLAYLLAILYALGVSEIEKILPDFKIKALKIFKSVLFKGAILLICFSIIYFYPSTKYPYQNTMEYNAAAQNYLKIFYGFQPLDWTIIGPTEQFQEAYGRGYHVEILNLVKEHMPEEVSNPKFDFKIPTHDIFVYIEKKPLDSKRYFTAEDAAKQLEPDKGNPFLQYYLNREQRTIIEAKAYNIVEAYRKSHTGVSIYYEDDNLRIYHIYHEVKIEGNAG